MADVVVEKSIVSVLGDLECVDAGVLKKIKY